MKNIIIVFLTLVFLSACTELELNPLSEGSSETWYSNEKEITMALNDLYQEYAWQKDPESNADDYTYRTGLTDITAGTINGESAIVKTFWQNYYKAISRANTILINLAENKANLPQAVVDKYSAEARFVRAANYAGLITHFGDVVYFTEILDLDQAFSMAKTPKNEILNSIYDDYDFAYNNLPETYGSSGFTRATKGAAMALKARIALYMGDWVIARDAAKAVMDLGLYTLHQDFAELFLSSTKNSSESIFLLPRSVELGVYLDRNVTRYAISRNAGGYASRDPSWDLLFAFLCEDGLPVDESPLFDPRDPFKNRDPRLTETIVPFDTPHLGIMYSPHPDSLTSYNFTTGQSQKNNDNRVNNQYGSFNGLIWKKGIDEDWSDDLNADPDNVIVRYADVLLMYAEAKIELNEIDESVLNAINMVRARAYGVDVNATTEYPAVTETDQAELRKILRIERRMELAYENLRYMDIIRWGLAEKVLNYDNYGMLNPDELKEKIVATGLWFFPETPEIDEDGVVNLQPIYEKGLIRLLSDRSFDASKQYLWPIPSKEILINSNLKQNPGY